MHVALTLSKHLKREHCVADQAEWYGRTPKSQTWHLLAAGLDQLRSLGRGSEETDHQKEVKEATLYTKEQSQIIHNSQPNKEHTQKYYRKKGRSPEVEGHWECLSQKESWAELCGEGSTWVTKKE